MAVKGRQKMWFIHSTFFQLGRLASFTMQPKIEVRWTMEKELQKDLTQHKVYELESGRMMIGRQKESEGLKEKERNIWRVRV